MKHNEPQHESQNDLVNDLVNEPHNEPQNDLVNEPRKSFWERWGNYNSNLSDALDHYYYKGLFHGLVLGSLVTFFVVRR